MTRKDGASVSPWLRLKEINGYLEAEAEQWADRTPAIRSLLDENTLNQRTFADVGRSRSLFLDYFKVETETPQENTIPLIQSLCQRPAESLLTYYRQALGLLIAAGGKDSTSTVLGPLARSMLNLTIDRSINGLMCIPLRLLMLKYVADPKRSLKGAYMMAEGEWKQLEAEKDLMRNMKAAKELELWRRMKLTIEENGRNVNSPLVQASLSRIQLLIADLHQVETHPSTSPPTLPYCAEKPTSQERCGQ